MNAKVLPTLAALALLVAALPNARAAQPRASDTTATTAGTTFALVPRAARWQPKTKAQVVAFRLGADNVFDGVVVFNGGRTTLTSVRIGCIVEVPNAQSGNGTILGNLLVGVWDDTDIVHVNIPPGEVGVVRAPEIPIDGIIAILIGLVLPAQTEVTATLGITQARWEDGRRYRRDPRRGFPEKPSSYLEAEFLGVTTSDIDAALESIVPVSSPPVPGAPARETVHECVDAPGWRCVISTLTGECIGSAMCASGFDCSSRCKAFVTVLPSNP